jgi:hypothetical protein
MAKVGNKIKRKAGKRKEDLWLLKVPLGMLFFFWV